MAALNLTCVASSNYTFPSPYLSAYGVVQFISTFLETHFCGVEFMSHALPKFCISAI